MSKNQVKRANKEHLRMICILKYNLVAYKSKFSGDCLKCSSIWKMFLRIKDPKIPVLFRSGWMYGTGPGKMQSFVWLKASSAKDAVLSADWLVGCGLALRD
jgi:hypothetical protein